MSWKSATTSPWTLAARLSLWYAASSFVLLLIATGLLYWTLTHSLLDEDDAYLAEKAMVLRTLMREHPNDTRTIEWEVQGESAVRPYSPVYSRIEDASGRVLFETRGMPAVPPGRSPVDLHLPDGRSLRVITAEVTGGASGRERLRIQVGLDRTYEDKVSAGYRKSLWLVLGFGLVACASVGYGMARRGVRPVQDISAKMRRIGSANLSERIDPAGLPAELSALAATFDEMLDRLEDGFARLSRFSSDIAHELRTPLNNLRGEIEVALERPRPAAEYRDALGSSLEECLRLSRLIDNLLFLARAENPRTEVRRERVDVGRELATVREFYDAAAAEAGIELGVQAPVELSAELDRTLFQRAVANLVENALAHTSRGGRITLGAEAREGEVLVSVEDTGCGIPAAELPHIFDRFRRVDGARSKDTGGLGLGLAIVKSIATLHGGAVHAKSAPGTGTRITLRFPLDEARSLTVAARIPN